MVAIAVAASGCGRIGFDPGDAGPGSADAPTSGDATGIDAGRDAAAAPCVVDVAAGYEQSCAVKGDGTAWCWGDNSVGELGVPGGGTSAMPVQVTALGDQVSRIYTATDRHACALMKDRTVWCWGENDNILADATFGGIKPPTQVPTLTGVTQVAIGYIHNCAIKTDGTVWCWGNDNGGQGLLGENGSGMQNTWDGGVQQVVPLGSDNARLGAGLQSTCVAKLDGSVWCWGCNSGYELGVDDTTVPDCTMSPHMVPAFTAATAVASGPDTTFTCTLKTDRSAWCWGSNYRGQFGDGNSGNYTWIPTQATSFTGDVEPLLAAGLDFTLARGATGSLWGWGLNIDGELGLGTMALSVTTPTEITALGSGVTAASGGDNHACAIVADGTAWCMGQNYAGMLGDGSINDSASPVKVALPCP